MSALKSLIHCGISRLSSENSDFPPFTARRVLPSDFVRPHFSCGRPQTAGALSRPGASRGCPRSGRSHKSSTASLPRPAASCGPPPPRRPAALGTALGAQWGCLLVGERVLLETQRKRWCCLLFARLLAASGCRRAAWRAVSSRLRTLSQQQLGLVSENPVLSCAARKQRRERDSTGHLRSAKQAGFLSSSRKT